VLHLVVDCSTSHCVWRTLEKMIASPSNSRIMQFRGSFQDLPQGDSSVSIYMQQAKRYLMNSVTTPIVRSVYPFNFHIKGKWSIIFFLFTKISNEILTESPLYREVSSYRQFTLHTFIITSIIGTNQPFNSFENIFRTNLHTQSPSHITCIS